MGNRNAAQTKAVAHAMKSASGSIKAVALAALLEQAELAGRSADLARADKLIGQIRSEFDAVITFLQDAQAQ